MNTKQLKLLASVSAVALGVASYAQKAWATAYELDSGAQITINVGADVMQTVDVTTTPASFGDIGIHQDGVDVATMVLKTDSTITEDPGPGARMVEDPSDAEAAAVVNVTGAFPTTDIYATYANAVDLTCTDAACIAATSEDLVLVTVTDDLGDAVPNNGAGPGTGVAAGDLATAADGQGTTDTAGKLSWAIGATIKTVPSANFYATGAYKGSFKMSLSY